MLYRDQRNLLAEALPLLQRSVELNPHHEAALVEYTLLLIRLGNKAGAANALTLLKSNILHSEHIEHTASIEEQIRNMAD